MCLLFCKVVLSLPGYLQAVNANTGQTGNIKMLASYRPPAREDHKRKVHKYFCFLQENKQSGNQYEYRDKCFNVTGKTD